MLVLATLWPEFWDDLTARPLGGADPHAQARELLAGRDITVPAAFTPAQLQLLRNAGDVRLAQAAGAQDGQVIQFLAGVPELLARYRNAPPDAAALIHAAMDARRMGTRAALPRDFLEAAAPGYLTDSDWDQLADDWLKQALAYTAAPCKGVPGPLTRIRLPQPRPGPRRGASGPSHDGTSLYRLADYLDQYGRRNRHALIPPPSFWTAAPCAQPADLTNLAAAARARGLYRYAAQLLKNAAARGDPRAGADLIDILHDLHPGDRRPAQWATIDIALDLRHTADVARLLDSLRKTSAQDQVTALLARDPAAHVSLDDPEASLSLLDSLREAGAQHQVTALADRAAEHVTLGDPDGVTSLLEWLREAGEQDQVTTLLARDPAAHVDLTVPGRVAHLLDWLREAGAQDQVTTLLAIATRRRTWNSATRSGSTPCWTACGRRASRTRSPRCRPAIRSSAPPSKPPPTRLASPAYGTARRRPTRKMRPPRWPSAPPAPSATRGVLPDCWTACGSRARRTWSPRCSSAPPTSPPATFRSASLPLSRHT